MSNGATNSNRSPWNPQPPPVASSAMKVTALRCRLDSAQPSSPSAKNPPPRALAATPRRNRWRSCSGPSDVWRTLSSRLVRVRAASPSRSVAAAAVRHRESAATVQTSRPLETACVRRAARTTRSPSCRCRCGHRCDARRQSLAPATCTPASPSPHPSRCPRSRRRPAPNRNRPAPAAARESSECSPASHHDAP